MQTNSIGPYMKMESAIFLISAGDTEGAIFSQWGVIFTLIYETCEI